jgi:ornithine cyclodeaminase/alanine dehydrogenase-like protein (mu-crystallin family)
MSDGAHDLRPLSAAQLAITLTVSDTPYAMIDWFRPGTFVAHVSLDDLRPDVFAGAEAVYVDDVGLVRENPRRILGRLMRDGLVAEPGGSAASGGRPLTGTLGDVLLGRVGARRPVDGVVVSNPFGMSILDVGLVDAVHAVAVAEGLGVRLDLLGGAYE